jgi:hypothetical protein
MMGAIHQMERELRAERVEDPEPMLPNWRMRGSCIKILERQLLRFVELQV